MRSRRAYLILAIVLASYVFSGWFTPGAQAARYSYKTFRVGSGTDDAYLSGSSFFLDSNIIKFTNDTDTVVVGLRFNNLDIAQGATIHDARVVIYFTDFASCAYRRWGSYRLEPILYEAWAEYVDNAATFSTKSNFESRLSAQTTNRHWYKWQSVHWNAGWSTYFTGMKQQVQDVVDRVGWSSGNSLVLYFRMPDGRDPTKVKGGMYQTWGPSFDFTGTPYAVKLEVATDEPTRTTVPGGSEADIVSAFECWTSDARSFYSNYTERFWAFGGNSTGVHYSSSISGSRWQNWNLLIPGATVDQELFDIWLEPNGEYFWYVWINKTPTPDELEVRKGQLHANGTVKWMAPMQTITYTGNSKIDIRPCIATNSEGYPFVSASHTSAAFYRVARAYWSTTNDGMFVGWEEIGYEDGLSGGLNPPNDYHRHTDLLPVGDGMEWIMTTENGAVLHATSRSFTGTASAGTWDAGQSLQGSDHGPSTHYNYWSAASGGNQVFCTWAKYSGGNTRIRLMNKTGAGGWGGAGGLQTVATYTGEDRRFKSTMVSDRSGNHMVGWWEPGGDLFYYRRRYANGTWADGSVQTVSVYYNPVIEDGSVTWAMMNAAAGTTVRTNGTGTKQRYDLVTGVASQELAIWMGHQLGQLSNGTYVFVYCEPDADDIWFTTSVDRASWTTPVKLNTGDLDANAAADPTIFVDAHDTIHVAMCAENGSQANREIWYLNKTATGDWSTPVWVSRGGTPNGDKLAPVMFIHPGQPELDPTIQLVWVGPEDADACQGAFYSNRSAGVWLATRVVLDDGGGTHNKWNAQVFQDSAGNVMAMWGRWNLVVANPGDRRMMYAVKPAVGSFGAATSLYGVLFGDYQEYFDAAFQPEDDMVYLGYSEGGTSDVRSGTWNIAGWTDGIEVSDDDSFPTVTVHNSTGDVYWIYAYVAGTNTGMRMYNVTSDSWDAEIDTVGTGHDMNAIRNLHPSAYAGERVTHPIKVDLANLKAGAFSQLYGEGSQTSPMSFSYQAADGGVYHMYLWLDLLDEGRALDSPWWSDVGYDSNVTGTDSTFFCSWDDTELSHWVFGTDVSGSWVNETYAFTTTPEDVNITKTLPQTNGTVISYRFWANNTDGLWNNTGIQTLTTEWITVEFDVIIPDADEIDDAGVIERWLFVGRTQYAFIFNFTVYDTTNFLAGIGFRDGAGEWFSMVYNRSSRTTTLVSPDDGISAVLETVDISGKLVTLTFNVMLNPPISDTYDVDVFTRIIDTTTDTGWGVLSQDLFNIYNLGGRTELTATGWAGRVTGGDAYEIYAADTRTPNLFDESFEDEVQELEQITTGVFRPIYAPLRWFTFQDQPYSNVTVVDRYPNTDSRPYAYGSGWRAGEKSMRIRTIDATNIIPYAVRRFRRVIYNETITAQIFWQSTAAGGVNSTTSKLKFSDVPTYLSASKPAIELWVESVMQTRGRLKVWNDTSGNWENCWQGPTIVRWESDNWYNITVVANVSSYTFDIYWEGVLTNATNMAFENNVNLEYFQAVGSDGLGGGEAADFYIDALEFNTDWDEPYGGRATVKAIYNQLQHWGMDFDLAVEDSYVTADYADFGYVELGWDVCIDNVWHNNYLVGRINVTRGEIPGDAKNLLDSFQDMTKGKANWVEFTISWYERGSRISTDTLYGLYEGHGVAETTPGAKDVMGWHWDVWFNRMDGSTWMGARLNCEWFGMESKSPSWMVWTSKWKPMIADETDSTFFMRLRNSTGDLKSAKDVSLVRPWARVWRNNESTFHYKVVNLERFDVRTTDETMSGIDTPPIIKTQVPHIASGFFGSALGAMFKRIMSNFANMIVMGGLMLWHYFAAFLDVLLSWAGIQGGVATFTAWIRNFWGWATMGLGWFMSMMTVSFSFMNTFMGKMVNTLTTVLTTWTTMIEYFFDFLDTGFNSGINVWNDFNMSQWLVVGAILYPWYILTKWDEEGGDAALGHIKMVLDIGALFLNLFLGLAQFFVTLLFSLIDAIPVIE